MRSSRARARSITFTTWDIKHTGHVGGHVTCGGIVYQGDAFPESFRNCYIGPNLLSNEVYWHQIQPKGSTFTTHYSGTLLKTDDIWFRPIDSLVGPDGALYVADWYDKRAGFSTIKSFSRRPPVSPSPRCRHTVQ